VKPATRIAQALLILAGLTACATQPPAPIESPGGTRTEAQVPLPAKRAPAPTKRPVAVTNGRYTVRRGDTLYAIAWRLGVDHRDLVRWNSLEDPDRIFVGQSLRVAVPRAPASRSTPTTTSVKPMPPAAPAPAPVVERQSAPPRSVNAMAVPAKPLAAAPVKGRWAWPAEGEARRSVSATGSNGLQIHGSRGEEVRAAAAGQVVYSGSGLRGYGQLLILKHDEVFLSAYAHNDALLVAEGARVQRGQTIARMGDSGASEVMLHFEIRKGGKAVDPLEYLPPR
jgi:lipoprotein NlpD